MAKCPEGRCYIGCTSNSMEYRFRTHEAYGRNWPGDDAALLGDAITKFGRDNFTLTKLAEVFDAGAAAAIETAMIAHYEAAGPRGYNCMKTSHYRASRLRGAKAA